MSDIAKSVAEIIADVRARGDQALLDYTERWDGVRLEAESLRVGSDLLGAAVEESDFAAAFTRAAARTASTVNIRKANLLLGSASTSYLTLIHSKN